MPYQDYVKLWDQQAEQAKLKWYRDEKRAGKPEPPTLFRVVKDYPDAENHFAGKLWFRSLPYFRNIKDEEGKDDLEGIGSYELVPDEKNLSRPWRRDPGRLYSELWRTSGIIEKVWRILFGGE